jgi:hypothetical protein
VEDQVGGSNSYGYNGESRCTRQHEQDSHVDGWPAEAGAGRRRYRSSPRGTRRPLRQRPTLCMSGFGVCSRWSSCHAPHRHGDGALP